MHYLIKRFAVAAIAAVMAIPASAATYSFDFEDRSQTYDRYYYSYGATSGDLAVKVTAGRYAGPRYGADRIIDSDCSDGGCGSWWKFRAVAKTSTGLGIGGFLDGSDIDGAYGNDLITFAFNKVVDFGKVFFTGVDRNDDFDVFVDGVLVREDVNISRQNPFNLASLAVRGGQSISFGADGHYDNFRIGGLEVSYAAVPLPAGGLLLLSGLFGLGMMRRRSTATA